MKGVDSNGKKENVKKGKQIHQEIKRKTVGDQRNKQTNKGIHEMQATQLATKDENTGLITQTESWGNEGVDSSDIMLPKILLMQGLSEAVNEDRASMGDIVNSLTYEKLGDKNTSVEVIPISTFKTWVVSTKEPKGSKFEYDSVLQMDASNVNLPMDETLSDGTEVRRDRTLNFYVLLSSELPQGDAFPYVVSFRRTSYPAGKKFINHFTKMSMLKASPAAKTLKLSCRIEKNDLGNYFVFDVDSGRISTKEEVGAAYEWYKTLSKGMFKVDNSDLKAPEPKSNDAEGTAEY